MKKLDDFTAKYFEDEEKIGGAILDLQIQSYQAVEKGKVMVVSAQAMFDELCGLISECMAISNPSDELQERFIQALVSVRPRLESLLSELKGLLENPPKESLFPKLVDIDLDPEEEEPISEKPPAAPEAPLSER